MASRGGLRVQLQRPARPDTARAGLPRGLIGPSPGGRRGTQFVAEICHTVRSLCQLFQALCLDFLY